MRRARVHPFPRSIVWLVAIALSAGAVLGQETDEIAAALEQTPTSELKLRLAPLPVEELEQVAASAMAGLRGLADELSAALIDQLRLRQETGASDDAIAAADGQVTTLLERKATLITRTEEILSAFKAKGGDAAAMQAYVAVVRSLEPQVDAGREPEELSEEERHRADLEKAVTTAIATVREEPPVHERPQPWTVSEAELELEMQPLRKAQVEERVQKWLEILEREVRKRIRIDIALSRVEDTEQRAELAERSAEQQEIVQAVVRRVEIALLLLRKRGGEITESKDYIATATGQKLNLTDPAVLYAQGVAWVKSPDGGIQLGLNLLKFIGILLAFWILSRILGKAMGTAVSRVPKASALLKKFMVGGLQRLTILIGLVIAVGALGVNITPLVAAIGAAGLVIGLALQGTLSNFASGILILFYRPYDVGDVIDGGGVTGKVESMNLVSTSIVTPDNRVMLVPNNQIWNGVITNVTGRDTRRVDLVFGIGYADDIEKATGILEEVLKAHEKVLADPAPVVKVSELADSSVNFIARPWTKTSDYWEVYWDLTRQVKERFDAEGLNIPFPQRDLHVPGTIEVKLTDGSLRPTAADVEIETRSPSPAR